ncbi:MAG: hypothetical protein WBE76_25940 [Terracidiphilus sp.]
MKRWVAVLLTLAISEVSGSFCAWHGTPTDWSGPPLHFWNYEFWRLAFWIPLAGGAFAIVLAIWHFLPGIRRCSVVMPLALVFALGVEWITSLSYWRALTIQQASFLGWPSEFYYIREHLLCWAISLLLAAAALLFWIRRKSVDRPISER